LALLRKIAARTVSTLWDVLGDVLDCFTPQECANYLAGICSAESESALAL